MSYNIKKTNGEPLFGSAGLPENEVDVSRTPIALIGKLTPDYGNYQSENFVHITENFANDVFPENPLKGQIAFNTTDNCMYICEDDISKKWTKMMSLRFERQTNPQTGDMYYDVANKQLFIYDETVGKYGEYVLIGPNNYNNKLFLSTVLDTNNDIKIGHYNVEIEPNTTNLITIKAVAKEKMNSELNPEYGVRKPECSAWVYRLVVDSHITETGGYETIIVDKPNYELIGCTNGSAKNWNITFKIFDNMLQINADGVATNNPLITSEMDTVKWEIDIEIVKV